MFLNFGNREVVNSLVVSNHSNTLCIPACSSPLERIFSTSRLIMRPQRARLSSEKLLILIYLKCHSNFLEKYIDETWWYRFMPIFRGRIIVGFGLGLDYSWSRSRTKGLAKRPVLILKQFSGLNLDLGLEARGLDYNSGKKTNLEVSGL